uniref:Taste 1 receptor member 1 n=1 Tax=Crocodylus porosus TaxID=8502 RepID=A0A7M4EZ72_CROPO
MSPRGVVLAPPCCGNAAAKAALWGTSSSARPPATMRAVLLLLLLLVASRCRAPHCPARFTRRGHYTVAGLFQIHVAPAAAARPEVQQCDRVDTLSSHDYQLFRTMRFTIEEINNSSSLLPNITLGYEIYDACSESANMYATLGVLAQNMRRRVEMISNFSHYQPRALAVIGPHSSGFALTSAAILSIFLMPEISYEASTEILSLKHTYPSFLRTIPSDSVQVEAMVFLMEDFRWNWVAMVGSDTDYGRKGMQTLYKAMTKRDICVAYRGLIPANKNASSLELKKMVRDIVGTKVNVTIIFSDRRSARVFFEVVVQENVTGKVWVGTENWLLAPLVSDVPGIYQVGTVIGMSVKDGQFAGMRASENTQPAACASDLGAKCCNQLCTQCHLLPPTSDPRAMKSSYNVYSAVYAVAHGLHSLLGCNSGACRKDEVYPWQLLQKIKQVNFSLHKNWVYFDDNGDPITGYDLIMWKWTGSAWSFDTIGSFSRNPNRLSIDWDRIVWHTEDNQVPASICSKPCERGEKRTQVGIHRCCFDCEACPAGTFLNRSDLYTCQSCKKSQWAPVHSETCFERHIEFLSWAEPVSWALLTAITLLMLLLMSTAIIFALNTTTPVVKSAGGKMCFLMLGALACASSSLYCHFGKPSWLTCQLRLPVFSISFSICLSCMAVRSFQIVCIFKLAAKWPALYETWMRHNGPNLFIGASTAVQVMLSLALLVTNPSVPHKDYERVAEVILFECSQENSVLVMFAVFYNVLLSVCCFVFSYMGTDLPKNYSEAKCITFSLLIYFTCSISYFTTYSIYQGKYLVAMNMLSLLCTLAGVFGGYFLPKGYIILFRADLNTTEYFQMAIQSYTTRRSSA